MVDVNDDDFFEEDEPVEEIFATFDAGPHGFTAPPLPEGATFVVAGLTGAAGEGCYVFPGVIGVQVTTAETALATTR